MGIYNGKQYIMQQLDCIRKQTKAPDEVILCDDGSTNGTREMLLQYIKEHNGTENWRVIFNEENKGYPGNFYYAMSLCTGDIVFLADQDDIWHLQKIERMLEIMKMDKQMKVLGCTFGLIDNKNEEIHTVMAPTKQQDTGKINQIPLDRVLYKCEWPGMVLAYRNDWYRKGAQKFGLLEYAKTMPDAAYGVKKNIPHDFYLCAMAAEEHGFFQLEERLAYHRRHDNNIGGEEHRVMRLLNKERKLKEIRDYNRIIDCFAKENVMQTREGKMILDKKRRSMHGRYKALLSGKISKVIGHAWKYRKEVRLATLVCDILIVKQKMKV